MLPGLLLSCVQAWGHGHALCQRQQGHSCREAGSCLLPNCRHTYSCLDCIEDWRRLHNDDW